MRPLVVLLALLLSPSSLVAQDVEGLPSWYRAQPRPPRTLAEVDGAVESYKQWRLEQDRLMEPSRRYFERIEAFEQERREEQRLGELIAANQHLFDFETSPAANAEERRSTWQWTGLASIGGLLLLLVTVIGRRHAREAAVANAPTSPASAASR